MALVVRPATHEEWPALLAAAAAGFLNDHPEPLAQVEATLDVTRTRCVFDGADIVATLAAFDFELAVPGGTTRAAGTTAVTVRPTHRRRGLLRRLMSSHLDEVRERGEPLAVLWASESGIYPRFGYGCAADVVTTVVETDRAGFVADAVAPLAVRLVTREDAQKILPGLYASHWRERPGWFARDSAWWQHRCFADRPERRRGGSALRYAVVEDGGTPTGYLQYQVKERWDERGVAVGEVWVQELVAGDAASSASLWRLAFDIDLTSKCVAWNDPVDSPLPWLLAEPRRATRHVRDALWLRILDVPAALEARRYATAERLVLSVRDPFRSEGEGCFAVEGGPDGARCRETTETAQLELDVCDLGALYLGGRSASALARAGRIAGAPDDVRRADAFFRWHVAPSCPEIF